MKTTAVFFVIVVTNPGGCIDSMLDRSNIEQINVLSQEECAQLANTLDEPKYQRAVCMEATR